MLQLLTAGPVAAGFAWTDAEAQQAHQHATAAQTAARTTGGAFKPKFFNAHEYATVRMLVDIIIPKDERSGSATEAGVPEFMDFIMGDEEARQLSMRGGLAWLDRECVTRFDKTFLNCAGSRAHAGARCDRLAAEGGARAVARRGLLQQLQGPHRKRVLDEPHRMKDIAYMGNVYVPEWTGCPDEVMKKLGL